MVLKTSKSS